jgi:hypothetical protein
MRRSLVVTVIVALVLLGASVLLHLWVTSSGAAAMAESLARDLESGDRFSQHALESFGPAERQQAIERARRAATELDDGSLDSAQVEDLSSRIRSAYKDGELDLGELRGLARELAELPLH